MTDTKAPKQIWVCEHMGEYGNFYPDAVEAEGEHGGTSVEYVRADLLTAAEAETERLARIVLAAEELAEAIEYEFHTFKQKWGDDCQIITAAIAYRKAVEGWE